MGSWSVASGMMLRDMLRKSDLEKERLEYEKDLDFAEKHFLEQSYSLGYMASVDRAGYLRAMSKARQTFKGLNPKDKYLGMVKYDEEKDNYYLNPDFVYVVEDFYFEMKRGVSREEYYKNKYEAFKKEHIELFENNPKSYATYPQEKFGISKEEMFDRIKKDELVICYEPKNNIERAVEYGEYVEGVKKGVFLKFSPLS